jgi:hypothetical protein
MPSQPTRCPLPTRMDEDCHQGLRAGDQAGAWVRGSGKGTEGRRLSHVPTDAGRGPSPRPLLGTSMLRRPRGHLWLTAFVVVGILLALVLVGQIVWTYAFVSRDLVRREARRQAPRNVTALERAIFAARIQEPEPLRPTLDGLQPDASTRIAWVDIVSMDAKTLLGSPADQQTLFTPAELRRTAVRAR